MRSALMISVSGVCAQAVGVGSGVPMVTEMGVGCLGQLVPTGCGIYRCAVAASCGVIPEADVQASRILQRSEKKN
jgi:hypothetical protein